MINIQGYEITEEFLSDALSVICKLNAHSQKLTFIDNPSMGVNTMHTPLTMQELTTLEDLICLFSCLSDVIKEREAISK